MTKLTGEATLRAGNQSTHAAPRNVYACADGGYVALSGSMQSMAMRIFDTIGRPELKTDPRFHDNTARVANRDALDAIAPAHCGLKVHDGCIDRFLLRAAEQIRIFSHRFLGCAQYAFCFDNLLSERP